MAGRHCRVMIRQIDISRPDGSLRGLAAGEAGPALVLLHGWPEFSAVWRPMLPALSRSFRVVAPDLRGFGDSLKPAEPPDIESYVADLTAVLDAWDMPVAGIVSHDVGAQIAQAFALAHPERVLRLVFANCPYPGIGRRWVEGRHVNEIWYQSFHQLPWVAEMVGSSRAACRAYIGHFLSHWAADPGAFDPVLDEWVDTFMKPGVLQGGFAWYCAVNETRLAQINEGPQPRPKIAAPSLCLWGAEDPLFPPHFAEGIEAYFNEITVEVVPNAGHFVFFERPQYAATRICEFFGVSGP